jgi:hypothetical protein
MVTFPAGYDLLILPGLEICEMPLILLTSGAFIAFQLDQQFNNANKIDSLIILLSFLYPLMVPNLNQCNDVSSTDKVELGSSNEF